MASIISAGTTSGTSLNLSGDTSGVLQLATNGSTTAVTVDTSQNVGIGTTTITSSAGWSPRLVLAGTDTALVVKGSSGQESTFGTSGGLYIDCLGHSTGTNNNIIFRNTSANSSFNSSERMRITTAGTIVLQGGNTSATGTGITFPATQSASSDANTLDDYEEGTWTPRIEGTGGSAGAQAYAAQFGRYVKIGRFVMLTGYLLLSNKGSYTSQVRLTGFPFTVTNENASYSGTSFYALNFNAPATTYGVGIYTIIGATSGDLWANSAGGVTVLTDYANQVTNNVQVGPLQICYYTNA